MQTTDWHASTSQAAIPLPPKLLTEFVGTFIFLTTIALAGAIGPLAPIPIGTALMVMVYMGGHISGGHFNPAVSFGAYLARKIDGPTLLGYWAVQLAAGILAFVFGYLVSGRTPGIHPGPGVGIGSSLAVEAVFTLALVLTVLNAAYTKATQGNSFYGLAIGFAIVIGAFAGGPVSGGAFNPAVGLGATLGAAVFHGDRWSDIWLYFVGPLIGGAVAAGIYALQGWLPGPAGAPVAPPGRPAHG